MSYKLTNNSTIIRLADGAFIPPDPRNRDFAEYQKWLALGNVPAPADTAPVKPPALALDDFADLLVAKGLVTRGEVEGKKK